MTTVFKIIKIKTVSTSKIKSIKEPLLMFFYQKKNFLETLNVNKFVRRMRWIKSFQLEKKKSFGKVISVCHEKSIFVLKFSHFDIPYQHILKTTKGEAQVYLQWILRLVVYKRVGSMELAWLEEDSTVSQ